MKNVHWPFSVTFVVIGACLNQLKLWQLCGNLCLTDHELAGHPFISVMQCVSSVRYELNAICMTKPRLAAVEH